jgi:hypothetical protein
MISEETVAVLLAYCLSLLLIVGTGIVFSIYNQKRESQ